MIVAEGENRTVVVWDVAAHTARVLVATDNQGIHGLQLAPDGQSVLVIRRTGNAARPNLVTMRLHTLAEGKMLASTTFTGVNAIQFGFSGDGQLLAGIVFGTPGTVGQSLMFLNPITLAGTAKIAVTGFDAASFTVERDAHLFAAGTAQGQVIFWSPSSRTASTGRNLLSSRGMLNMFSAATVFR